MSLYERVASHLIGTPLQRPAEWLRHVKGAGFRRNHPELGEIFREDERIDQVMRKAIGADTNCIDIGCHLGAYLQKIVTLAPQGRHHAVEPVPQKAAWLRNKFPGVSVLEVALDDAEGTKDFFVDPAQSALSGLSAGPTRGAREPLRVQCRRLDDLIDDETTIGFIKVDVNGGGAAGAPGRAPPAPSRSPVRSAGLHARRARCLRDHPRRGLRFRRRRGRLPHLPSQGPSRRRRADGRGGLPHEHASTRSRRSTTPSFRRARVERRGDRFAHALSYRRVSTNSRWPSASAAVSRPFAVRSMHSSSLSPAWSSVDLALQQARGVDVDVLAHQPHGARVGADLDHRQDRVADHVALTGREEVHRVAGRRAQRHHLGRGARRVHEPQARMGRRSRPCRSRRRPCTSCRSSGCCRAPSPRSSSGRRRCCPWSAAMSDRSLVLWRLITSW